MRVDTGPSVLFSKLAWQKMWALVHNCKIEISWFGYVMPEEEKNKLGISETYYVEDIYVVDQECTGVKSDMLPDAVSNLCIKLLDEDKDPSRLKLWGHSHVNMSVGFSGTDEATIEKLELEPLLSIVLNKQGDVNLRCDIWKPFRHSADCTYAVEDVQLIPDSWAEELIKEHVKKPKVVHSYNFGKKVTNNKTSVTSTFYNGWGNSSWDAWDDYASAKTGPPSRSVKARDLEDAHEFAGYEIDLPEEIDFLEEMFVKGEININELMEVYAHFRLNNDSVEAVMDFLTEDDPNKEAHEQVEIEFIPEGEDDEYESPMDDPFYVNENPSSLKTNGTKLAIAEAK